MVKKIGRLVECFVCEEDFFVPGITEKEAKELSSQVVICPECRKAREKEKPHK